MLTCQILFKSVYCVTFQEQKPQFWQFLTFGELLYPAPLPLTTVYPYVPISSQSVYSVTLWRQKTQILQILPQDAEVYFSILRCYQLAAI